MNYNYRVLLVNFKSRQKSFLSLLEKRVSFQTYTGEKKNINRFLDYLEELFAEFYPRSSFLPPIKIENNRFFANGCYDMKSGSALFYYALKAFDHFGLKPGKQIKIIFSAYEENGSTTHFV